MQLITISEYKMVCSKELHSFLEIETRYDTWIDRRISEYDFIEGQDFVTIKKERHKDLTLLRLLMNVMVQLIVTQLKYLNQSLKNGVQTNEIYRAA